MNEQKSVGVGIFAVLMLCGEWTVHTNIYVFINHGCMLACERSVKSSLDGKRSTCTKIASSNAPCLHAYGTHVKYRHNLHALHTSYIHIRYFFFPLVSIEYLVIISPKLNFASSKYDVLKITLWPNRTLVLFARECFFSHFNVLTEKHKRIDRSILSARVYDCSTEHWKGS